GTTAPWTDRRRARRSPIRRRYLLPDAAFRGTRGAAADAAGNPAAPEAGGAVHTRAFQLPARRTRSLAGTLCRVRCFIRRAAGAGGQGSERHRRAPADPVPRGG